MKTAILFLILNFSVVVHAEPKGCLSEASTKWVRNYFKINMDQRADYCDPANRHYQVTESILFMARLNLDGPLPRRPYNQNILGVDFINRLARHSPAILWGPSINSGASVCAGANAFAGPAPHNLGRQYLCPSFFGEGKSRLSVLSQISTMMHETRHLEGNGFFHRPCKGRKQGCDTSASARGAFAASMEAYAKIGLTATNVHPSISVYSRRSAYVVAVDRFVTPAVQEMESEHVVLLRDKDSGKLQLFSYRFRAEGFKWLGSGRLFPYDRGNFILVPQNPEEPAVGFSGTEVYARAEDGSFQEAIDGSSSFIKYYNRAPVNERKTLVAYLRGQTYRAHFEVTIWNDKIRVFISSNFGEGLEKSFELQLPEGKPVRLVPKEGDIEGRVFVISDSGKQFLLSVDGRGKKDPELLPSNEELPPVAVSAEVEVLEEKQAYRKREIQFLEEVQKKRKKRDTSPFPRYWEEAPPEKYLTYVLGEDGAVKLKTPEGLQPVPELRGRRFDFMSGGFGFYDPLPTELQDF